MCTVHEDSRIRYYIYLPQLNEADDKMETGVCTDEDFREMIEDFSRVASTHNDHRWEVFNYKVDEKTLRFLIRKELKTISLNRSTSLGTENSMENYEASEVEDGDEIPVLPPSGENALYPVFFEYHVLYSTSYNVPVLYFNASHSDGRLLSLEEIWSVIPAVYKHSLKNELWSVVTQQEHPILGRPFFLIHPCHTQHLLSQVSTKPLKEKWQYLVRWLSAIGPLVLLETSLELGKTCESFQNEEQGT